MTPTSSIPLLNAWSTCPCLVEERVSSVITVYVYLGVSFKQTERFLQERGARGKSVVGDHNT